jgi:hypothetical protein
MIQKKIKPFMIFVIVTGLAIRCFYAFSDYMDRKIISESDSEGHPSENENVITSVR